MPEAVAAAGAFGQGQPVPGAAAVSAGVLPGDDGARHAAAQGYYPQMPGYGMQPPGSAVRAAGVRGGDGSAHKSQPAAEEMMTPTGPTSPAQPWRVEGVDNPSQREWAATRLAEYNGHVQPTVTDG
jgi:hypothetical protein